MLELMARGGMRIGEVLKLRLKDLQDRKLILQEPKSGREHELVFIPQKVADRLREYLLAPHLNTTSQPQEFNRNIKSRESLKSIKEI
jgi:integrase